VLQEEENWLSAYHGALRCNQPPSASPPSDMMPWEAASTCNCDAVRPTTAKEREDIGCLSSFNCKLHFAGISASQPHLAVTCRSRVLSEGNCCWCAKTSSMPFYSLYYESFPELAAACPLRLSHIFDLAAPIPPQTPLCFSSRPFFSVGQAVHLHCGLIKTRVISFHLLEWPAIQNPKS